MRKRVSFKHGVFEVLQQDNDKYFILLEEKGIDHECALGGLSEATLRKIAKAIETVLDSKKEK